jgi:Uma2 family endonuclease
MSTVARPVTADELLRMPGDGRRELIRGEVREMAPAGSEHGCVAMNVALLLASHAKGNDLGVVFAAETGFKLQQNPDTVRGADVSFISKKRIPASGLPKGFWPGAPDLAVEVVSPGDSAEDVQQKVDEYLAAGSRMVWVVLPRPKAVMVHRPGQNPRLVREGDELSGEDVVNGFSCKVAEFFR